MSADRLRDTRGTVKVTCPHGCGTLIWPGAHDSHCPGIPEWRNPPARVKLIHVTPRELMAQGAWETARDILGYGQWVFDSGLKSLDCDLILTAAEAREAGYVSPRAPWWRLNGRQVARWLFIFGAGAVAGAASALSMSRPRDWPISHPLDYMLIGAGVLAMIPWLVMACRTRRPKVERRS